MTVKVYTSHIVFPCRLLHLPLPHCLRHLLIKDLRHHLLYRECPNVKDYNMGFWKMLLLPALSLRLVGLLQTCLVLHYSVYHHHFQRVDFFFLLHLRKNDESCVSSLTEHVCRLKITDNRQVVGKSVIPLHICQDLG